MIDLDRCPTCGVPWPPSIADPLADAAGDRDLVSIACMEPHPHPGRAHWHRSQRHTLGQLLTWWADDE